MHRHPLVKRCWLECESNYRIHLALSGPWPLISPSVVDDFESRHSITPKLWDATGKQPGVDGVSYAQLCRKAQPPASFAPASPTPHCRTQLPPNGNSSVSDCVQCMCEEKVIEPRTEARAEELIKITLVQLRSILFRLRGVPEDRWFEISQAANAIAALSTIRGRAIFRALHFLMNASSTEVNTQQMDLWLPLLEIDRTWIFFSSRVKQHQLLESVSSLASVRTADMTRQNASEPESILGTLILAWSNLLLAQA